MTDNQLPLFDDSDYKIITQSLTPSWEVTYIYRYPNDWVQTLHGSQLRHILQRMENEHIDISYGETEAQARKLFRECLPTDSEYIRIKSMTKISKVKLTQEGLKNQKEIATKRRTYTDYGIANRS
jgi:hypothetical protein